MVEGEGQSLVLAVTLMVYCGVSWQELELRWQEYYERVTMLLQWIRHYTVIFEEKRFPASYEEIEVCGVTERCRPAEISAWFL